MLTRLLIKSGAEVKIIITAAAADFITPLTLATLSKNPVLRDFQQDDTGVWNNHVDLGLWADVMLIAPASAHTMAKMAHGICDNLLLATYLSARCPVFVAPAMDLDMYVHPATKSNLEKLLSYGHHVIDATHGELASGLVGVGRMAEPEQIVNRLNEHFHTAGTLKNKHIMITAGPTYEAFDPVRFIGNHSSGKMGYALAAAAAAEGATVSLVSGPTHLSLNHPNIQVTRVTAAEEMYQQCRAILPKADVCIFAAAVADYKPEKVHDQKIKKKDANYTITLTKTIDIAATLGKDKKENQIMVGFALETENEHLNAQEKLKAKNFDMIILNSLNDEGAGFGHDTNKITLIDKENKSKEFQLKSKKQVAKDIIEAIREKVNG